jgi:acyl homoserine lactone synthase
MQIITGNSSEFSADLEIAIAEYRHKIFIERLGWPLPSKNGVERDQFDRADTVYVVVRNKNNEICGCARLLPTTKPYLLGEVFPFLLPKQSIPHSSDVWELSRFAATHVANTSESPLNASIATQRLLAASITSAAQHGAKRLITVSPIGVERLLHRMGVNAHRASPPATVQGESIFACWIEIDDQTLHALDINTARVDSHSH